MSRHRWKVLAAIAFIAATPAQASYFTYFQWLALPAADRAAYAAGAFDSYAGFAEDYTNVAQFYVQCAANLKIDNGQLASGIQALATAHPEFQSIPVPGLMIKYLLQVCGQPPA